MISIFYIFWLSLLAIPNNSIVQISSTAIGSHSCLYGNSSDFWMIQTKNAKSKGINASLITQDLILYIASSFSPIYLRKQQNIYSIKNLPLKHARALLIPVYN